MTAGHLPGTVPTLILSIVINGKKAVTTARKNLPILLPVFLIEAGKTMT